MYFANQIRPAGAIPDNIQILLAEDDAMLGHLIELTLRRRGYKVVTVQNGLEALEAFQQGEFDLVLLDVNMPVMDGFAACTELRRTTSIPIMMVSALSTTENIVTGINLGADHYIVKPFSLKELLARVDAMLRRTSAPALPDRTRWVTVGDVSLNSETREVKIGDRSIDLTPKEFKMLAHFVNNPNTVITRANLLKHVWGYELSDDNDLVRVTISRLRAKMEYDPARRSRLVTVYRVGYRLSGVAATSPIPVSLPVATPDHRGLSPKSSH